MLKLQKEREEFQKLSDDEKIKHNIVEQDAIIYLKMDEKWKELKDMWAAQNNRNKMRYWTFIEWKANEVLEGLEKGQNIDISSWISLKAQFDEYLKKGTDA